MANTDGVAGTIGQAVMQPTGATADALRARIADGREKALQGVDAVFDTERMMFYVHGKHPLLAGVEAKVALPLADMLSMLSGVIPNVLVPVVLAASQAVTKVPPSGRGA